MAFEDLEEELECLGFGQQWLETEAMRLRQVQFVRYHANAALREKYLIPAVRAHKKAIRLKYRGSPKGKAYVKAKNAKYRAKHLATDPVAFKARMAAHQKKYRMKLKAAKQNGNQKTEL